MSDLNLDSFSQDSRKVLERAQNLARKRRHQYIDQIHALTSLLTLEGAVPALLGKVGANVDVMLAELDRELGFKLSGRGEASIYVADDLVAVIKSAERESGGAVEPQHLLVAIASAPKGMASRLLRQQGASPEALRAATQSASPKEAARAIKGADLKDFKIDLLAKHGRDMTAMAEAGQFDPVIGREAEIRRVMQVLTRRSKNNPVLIGAPGVGKTAIVEALCQRLTSSDVPEGLRGRRVFSLDLGSLVAGTSLRGQFEERVKGIIDEIVASNGRVIVYIDEIHNMVGAGGQEGSGSAANLLKPALARGEMRCIGSTTPEEYKQHIEEDKALVRRFQQIEVDEFDVDQTIAVLRGIKRRYEIHHGVKVLDAALVAAARFAERYITDRHQPDKAIDLIDEAASRIRLEIDSKPTEIDHLERRIESLEIERAAIVGEKTVEAGDSLGRIDKELKELRPRVDGLLSHWRKEKELLDRITDIQEQLEATELNIEKARRESDLGRAAELQYGVKIELEKQLEERSKAMAAIQTEMRLLKQEVDASAVADVVSDITSIPVSRMLEGEREKLLRMEHTLSHRVVGQDEAIASISKAVRMSRAGVSNPNKPIGSFLFVGPTGVGKTELAKALAEFLFDSEDALIRIDMSEYQEQAKVNTLIGSARGYVGSEKGGVLTEAVRRRPYSVVLFDEAEKAHPKVFDLLLQVLDEGRLSDSQGLEVDFTNTIVIMTSNVGSREILDMTGTMTNEQMEVQIRALIKNYLKPEFINRIQDIVVFNALRMTAIRLIADIQIKKLRKLLVDQKLDINLTDDAADWISQAGYEPEYGARPLTRAILNHIQDPLSMLILEGKYAPGETITIDVAEDGTALVFKGYE